MVIDLNTPEGYQEFSKKVLNCLRKNKGNVIEQDHEDCVNHIIMKWMEYEKKHGKRPSQTIDQAVIDYLRKGGGRKGAVSYEQRKSLNGAISIEKLRDSGIELGVGGNNHENGIDVSKYLIGHDRAVFLLKVKWGLSEIEIGNIFNVSGSRIHQRLKGVQERLSKRIEKEKSKTERKGKESMESLLQKETGGEFWRVESFEDRGLEVKEPLAMESY